MSACKPKLSQLIVHFCASLLIFFASGQARAADDPQVAARASLERIQSLRKQRPDDGLLVFYEAITRIALAERDAAFTLLRTLKSRKLGLIPVHDFGFESVWGDPEFEKLRKELADPYSLCPAGSAPNVRQPDVRWAEFDVDFGAWVAPFVMSAINTRIVHRSNALSEQAYGADFTYDEAMLMGRGLKGRFAAAAMAAGLAGFMLAAAIRPARAALEHFVLPKPGEGPSPEAQRKGFFDLRFLGTTADGRQIRTKVTGDRDPGYGSTGKMLGQAAACLALDVDKAATPGGFWTPATIFGDRLIQRLTAHSGLAFEVVPDLQN